MEKPSVVVPAGILVVISFIVSSLGQTYPFSIYGLTASCTSTLIGAGLAYATCWALVLRKNKGMNAVWVNYIIWILILNAESIANLLGN